MPSWSRLRQLALGDWLLFVVALVLLPIVNVALRLWGFRRVYGVLLILSPQPAGDQPSISAAEIARLVQMVNAAANRGLVRATCLRRSLAIWWLLRYRGLQSELKIGVRRRDGNFEAHAWIEGNGVVLNDRPDIGREFAVFDSDGSLPDLQWV